VFLGYWVRVFQEFEKLSSVNGLTFYVVWGYLSVRDLPTYGSDVVVIVLVDEGCLIPHYLGQVNFVFKTYGFRPWSGGRTGGQMGLLLMMKGVRDHVRWMLHLAKFMYENKRFSIPREGRAVLPLGYARQKDLPVKPFHARRYLVSFLGSIEHYGDGYCYRWLPRAFFGGPKGLARSRMAASLTKLASVMPDEVFFATTPSFFESISTDGARYSEIMADTKICLAPRGASVETYRLFEALRCGCVVIGDRLPPHWFYEGCPVVQLEDWRDLDAAIEALTRDPQQLIELHRKSLNWWETKCSEKAVAAMLARCLKRPDAPLLMNRPLCLSPLNFCDRCGGI
jgi:hypothetical protein